jgi:hypothetical protein
MNLGFRLNSLPLVHRSTPGYHLSLLRSFLLTCVGFEVAESTEPNSVTTYMYPIGCLDGELSRGFP